MIMTDLIDGVVFWGWGYMMMDRYLFHVTMGA